MRKINNTDINRIVKKVIKENREDNEMIYGISYNKQTELVDDVIMRIKEYGNEYMVKLNELNYEFPTKKYKRVERPNKDTIQLPKGVRVQSSVFPED
jgi:hypothetical protein